MKNKDGESPIDFLRLRRDTIRAFDDGKDFIQARRPESRATRNGARGRRERVQRRQREA